MNISAAHLRDYVIHPTLESLSMFSPTAATLLLATAATESGFNPFCQRAGLGIYQISSAQHRGVWDDYLAFQPDLASQVRGLASQHQFLREPDRELITNLSYATAITWVRYLQCSDNLPETDDVDVLSQCWLSCYQRQRHNAELGNFSRWLRDSELAA